MVPVFSTGDESSDDVVGVGVGVVVVCLESNQKDKGQDDEVFFAGTMLATLPLSVPCVCVVVVMVLFGVDPDSQTSEDVA